ITTSVHRRFTRTRDGPPKPTRGRSAFKTQMMTNRKNFKKTKRLCGAVALLIGLVCLIWGCKTNAVRTDGAIELGGTWGFSIDTNDLGVEERWYETALGDRVTLPGSMTTNGKGFDVDVNTPWTGSIM